MSKEETLTEKWGKLGFLDGIENTDDRDMLSNLYEESAKMIISMSETDNENQMRLESMFFPILRRSMERTNFEYEPNLNLLYQFLFKELYTNNEVKFYFENCSGINGTIDCEAEGILMLSDLVITELENGRLL